MGPLPIHDFRAVTGCFIEGQNFQFLRDNTGIADYGPKTLGPKGNHQHWNLLTPTKLCVTIGQAFIAGYVGKEVALLNPDGKTSNCVTIENHL